MGRLPHNQYTVLNRQDRDRRRLTASGEFKPSATAHKRDYKAELVSGYK